MEADIVDERPRPRQRPEEARRRTSSGRPARPRSASAWARACTTGSRRRSTRATSPRTARSRRPTSTTRRSRGSTFQDALITSVTVPKLDGSTQGRGVLRHRVRGRDRFAGPRATARTSAARSARSRRRGCARTSASRSAACRATASPTIDSFTWKCAVAPDQIGIFREPTKHPAKVTVPDLKLAHLERRPRRVGGRGEEVVHRWPPPRGRRDARPHRVPRPEHDRRSSARSTLKNVGFKKFSDDDHEANSEKIKRFNVELYVEKMKFKLNEYDA